MKRYKDLVKENSGIWVHEPLPTLDKRLNNTDKKWVEDTVREWLDEDEEGQNNYDLGKYPNNASFTKSTVSVKTCGNVWMIYNIATSSEWSTVISSKRIAQIGDNSGGLPDGLRSLPNEIRSNGYNRRSGFLYKLKRRLTFRKKRQKTGE